MKTISKTISHIQNNGEEQLYKAEVRLTEDENMVSVNDLRSIENFGSFTLIFEDGIIKIYRLDGQDLDYFSNIYNVLLKIGEEIFLNK